MKKLKYKRTVSLKYYCGCDDPRHECHEGVYDAESYVVTLVNIYNTSNKIRLYGDSFIEVAKKALKYLKRTNAVTSQKPVNWICSN